MTALFQFQNGSIKSKGAVGYGIVNFEFQFQNGSIKSIEGYIGMDWFIKFQFQNGSIKSDASKSYPFYLFLFQFQNGSIKSVFFYRLFFDFS